jgi:hypothetical protein
MAFGMALLPNDLFSLDRLEYAAASQSLRAFIDGPMLTEYFTARNWLQ